jgi:hypothetical protein
VSRGRAGVTKRLETDHLVYAVPNLANALDEFERRLGFAPSLGGRHEGLGTHNAILPLEGEIYLELIASDPDRPAPKQPRPFGLDVLHGPRLVTWAVRSRTIESDVAGARERGFDPGIVFEMSRDEPSGDALRWKLSLRSEPFGDGLVPFLIDWGTTPHPSNTAASKASRCVLSSFSARHPNPTMIRAALDALHVDLEVGLAVKAGLKARITGPRGSLELDLEE